MKHTVFQNIKRDLAEGKITDQYLESDGCSYVRRWCVQERLILLGGGHIAQPLAKIGAMLDFLVTVVDDRPAFADGQRFLEAESVICSDFGEAIDALRLGAGDFVCVITRGHRYDADCLRKILSGEATKYLGMIGSKRRVEGLIGLLRQEGYASRRLGQVCAPIGLAIHAQTPAEIAVAVAAQLVEYRRRDAGVGRDNKTDYLPQTNVDLPLLEALADPKEPLALAVVVATKGSTPVKAGAMMAVGKLGRVEGTVGGGCGEAEVIQAARKLAGTAETVTIHVGMDNEAAEEEGMACGGTMEVLLAGIE